MSLCDTCQYDCVAGCLFYCGGVTGWDEENEAVTSCQDYEQNAVVTIFDPVMNNNEQLMPENAQQ